MKKLLKIALFLTFSNAFSAPITEIQISGLNTISRGTVLNYLPLEVGDNYTQNASDNIIRTLYKTNFFKDIEISQAEGILSVHLTENPSIKYIDILNYSDKVLQKKTLNQTLQDTGLAQGEIFNPQLLKDLITQIKNSYLSKGYYGVKINKKVVTDNKNRVSIKISINEGEVAKVNSLHILGNQVFNEKKLLDLFEIGTTGTFNFFTQKNHYSKLALDSGVEAIKSLYINNGYLDFTVIKTDTKLSEDKKSIDISIEINEGNEYKVGEINFKGNLLNHSTEKLIKLLSVQSGQVFKRKEVIKSIQNITDTFADEGYAFVKVDPKTKENTDKKTIDIDIDISTNQQIYINRITISGNTRTQDEVIRREIGIVEGGLYSNTDLNESITHIKRLGFFSDVKMKVSRIKNMPDKINLHFSVKEEKTGTFSIGLSHSNSSGASFNLGIKEKNFLGTGNTLNATLENSKAVKEINLYFHNPYFTTDKHSISYGIFSKSIDGSALDVSSYKIDEKGFLVGYGIPISKDTRIGINLRASRRNIACGSIFSDINHEQAQCSNDDKDELNANINWSNNTLNEYNFPTTGMKTNLSLGVTLPSSDFRYYKTNISNHYYHPINKNLTFHTKAKIGFAGGLNGKELPFFKRYYGGGSSSVRGFNFNSLGAKYPDGKAKGGELSLLGSVSIVSKLGFLNNSNNMRMTAFIDAGSISEGSTATDSLRASAGISFQWLTPIGPLGFYAAKPIIKKDGDETKKFDFTLGTSF
jgi:outer membrane protein insertion porin family